jgi:hypothetical protein
VHPSAAAGHTSVTKSDGLDKDHGRLVREVHETPEEVLHILHMLRDTLVVYGKLDYDEVGLVGNVQRKAVGEVVGSSG